jgi:glycosyltransferase involved in cell wall biosynthesis
VKPVLHIITTIARGGAENQLLTLVREQRAGKRPVSVLFLKDSPDLLPDLLKLGVNVIEKASGKNLLTQFWVTRKILSGQDLIIHAHLPRAQILAALAKRKHPLIISKHDAEPFYPNGNKYVSIFLARLVAMRSDLAIAISNSVKEAMKSSHEFPRRFPIEVVHYGYDVGFLEPVTSLRARNEIDAALKDGKLVFGTVARLVYQKDYPTLLEAFALYCSNYSDGHLLIAGDGPLRNELIEQSKKLAISDKITWLGHRKDISDVLNAMDVFILASKTEGFGLVLLEAMSKKLPIIASNSTAIPEVLGENGGVLFQTGNVLDLFEKMQDIRELNVRADMKKKAFYRLEFFSPGNMRIKIDRLYLKVGA